MAGDDGIGENRHAVKHLLVEQGKVAQKRVDVSVVDAVARVAQDVEAVEVGGTAKTALKRVDDVVGDAVEGAHRGPVRSEGVSVGCRLAGVAELVVAEPRARRDLQVVVAVVVRVEADLDAARVVEAAKEAQSLARVVLCELLDVLGRVHADEVGKLVVDWGLAKLAAAHIGTDLEGEPEDGADDGIEATQDVANDAAEATLLVLFLLLVDDLFPANDATLGGHGHFAKNKLDNVGSATLPAVAAAANPAKEENEAVQATRNDAKRHNHPQRHELTGKLDIERSYDLFVLSKHARQELLRRLGQPDDVGSESRIQVVGRRFVLIVHLLIFLGLDLHALGLDVDHLNIRGNRNLVLVVFFSRGYLLVRGGHGWLNEQVLWARELRGQKGSTVSPVSHKARLEVCNAIPDLVCLEVLRNTRGTARVASGSASASTLILTSVVDLSASSPSLLNQH